MKIKKILANELQLNINDIILTFCFNCKTDYTLLAQLGKEHDCHIPAMAEQRDISGQEIPNHISRAIPLHLLGNRSTDHHNERQYEHFSGYEAWAHLDKQVIENGMTPIGDKAQLLILRKETKTGGVQPSPFTEDFVSFPRKCLTSILSFFNLETKTTS